MVTVCSWGGSHGLARNNNSLQATYMQCSQIEFSYHFTSVVLAVVSSQLSTSSSTARTDSSLPRVGPGHPSSPLVHLLPHLFPLFYFPLSFIGFTYFLLLSIPSLSTTIVPLRFQAGGRRRRPNLGLVCVLLCNLCYLYSLVKMDCGVLFY